MRDSVTQVNASNLPTPSDARLTILLVMEAEDVLRPVDLCPSSPLISPPFALLPSDFKTTVYLWVQ